MHAGNSKRLVIDASVAHAAGGKDAVFPASKLCRDFLGAVLRICHRVVFTPAIREEWNRHQSGYASEWRTSMAARRKTCILPDVQRPGIRRKAADTTTSDKDRGALLKDFRLISAALDSDHTIVSLDETARGLFSAASQATGELRNLVWANPSVVTEDLISWLQDGAPAEANRRLGHQQ